MIYLRTDARLTSSLQCFSFCRCFKMAEIFMNEENILPDRVKVEKKSWTRNTNTNVPLRFKTQQRAKYHYRAHGELYHSLKVSPTLYQNWLRNHQPQRTQIFTVTKILSFKTRMLTAIASFPSVLFSIPATSKLFGSQGCSDEKNWLFFYDFAVQFCFRCKSKFH